MALDDTLPVQLGAEYDVSRGEHVERDRAEEQEHNQDTPELKQLKLEWILVDNSINTTTILMYV